MLDAIVAAVQRREASPPSHPRPPALLGPDGQAGQGLGEGAGLPTGVAPAKPKMPPHTDSLPETEARRGRPSTWGREAGRASCEAPGLVCGQRHQWASMEPMRCCRLGLPGSVEWQHFFLLCPPLASATSMKSPPPGPLALPVWLVLAGAAEVEAEAALAGAVPAEAV